MAGEQQDAGSVASTEMAAAGVAERAAEGLVGGPVAEFGESGLLHRTASLHVGLAGGPEYSDVSLGQHGSRSC